MSEAKNGTQGTVDTCGMRKFRMLWWKLRRRSTLENARLEDGWRKQTSHNTLAATSLSRAPSLYTPRSLALSWVELSPQAGL